MKKNAMLKIAAILLVAVLLTTCAISTTFAKYVTANANAGSATARVAKWGVTVVTDAATNNVDELFLKTYGTTDTAKIDASVPVVAPGSYNKLTLSNLVTGTPEVSGKITVTATVEFTNWTVDSNEYMPLRFRITNNGVAGSWLTIGDDTIDEFEDAIEAAINACETQFKANEAIAAATGLTIEWDWAFNGTDASDTALGNAATAPAISISLQVGAQQTGPAAVAA